MVAAVPDRTTRAAPSGRGASAVSTSPFSQ
ncbi:Uncharacterised protein [Mycobacteroides abscessus subsp. abscessus]|nr:Uncharacterised protein [Mycobacteroides abscessus subsp. abscessus]